MKPLYFIVGCLATLIGGIGIILPVLPTTPFLLLATFCFAKSSKRFHTWFIATTFYQRHVDTFVQHRSMTLHTKINLLAFASSMILLAMYFIDILYVRVFLVVLMIFKYYYFIFRIKTIRTQ